LNIDKLDNICTSHSHFLFSREFQSFSAVWLLLFTYT